MKTQRKQAISTYFATQRVSKKVKKPINKQLI